jgi:MOSC domain-containing protein YiiM
VLTVEELERGWGAMTGERVRAVVLITIRLGEGRHRTPDRVTLSPERGVHGDRWAHGRRKDPDAQVTLMDARVARLLAAGGAPLHAAGDNFLVDLYLSIEALPAGTALRLGSAVLEVSAKPHTGCKKFLERFGPGALAWVNASTNRPLRLRGINCRVRSGGEAAVADTVAIA